MLPETFIRDGATLVCRTGRETLILEGAGDNAIRMCATKNAEFDNTLPSGLLPGAPTTDAAIEIEEGRARIVTGALSAEVTLNAGGLEPTLELSFHDAEGAALLTESAPHILYPNTRNYDAVDGALWRIETQFAAHDGERFSGLIWNNPGIGRVELAQNRTKWVMEATPQLDYVVMAGDARQVLQSYVALTGHPPMMPDWAMGFWQCKLRYSTQE